MTQPQPDNLADNQAGSLADSQPDSLADYYPLSHAEHALAAYDRQGETRLLEYVKEHALREESPEGQTAAATSYKGRRWFFNDDSVVWLHDPWWRETTREDAGMAESEENDGDVPPKYRFTWRYGNTERVIDGRPAGRDFPRLDEAQLSYTQRAYQLLTEDGEVALLDFLLEHGDCANQPREDDIAQNQWECRVFIFPDHSLVEMPEGINKEWKFAEANMSHSVPMADSVEEELPDDPPVNRPLFNNWPTTRSTMKEALLNLENQVRQEMNLPLVSNDLRPVEPVVGLFEAHTRHWRLFKAVEDSHQGQQQRYVHVAQALRQFEVLCASEAINQMPGQARQELLQDIRRKLTAPTTGTGNQS